MTIGQKIYDLRTAQNLSQGELAEKLDVSRQSVSKWETDSAIPDLEKLMKLCDLFGVTLDELVGRGDAEEKQSAPSASTSVQPNAQPAPNTALSTQKIVGYILLAVSLLGGILLAIFVDPAPAVFIALPMLICAIVCLEVKRRAGYWCMWTVWFFADLCLKIIIGRYGVNGMILADRVALYMGFSAVLYVILLICTFRAFKDEPLPKHKQKGIPLMIAWVVNLMICVLPIWMLKMTDSLNMFRVLMIYILPEIIPTVAAPFLFIYTARYFIGRKYDRK